MNRNSAKTIYSKNNPFHKKKLNSINYFGKILANQDMTIDGLLY